MIAIRGAGSTISREVVARIPDDEKAFVIGRGHAMPNNCEHYLFAAGLIRPKRGHDQTVNEIRETWKVNFLDVRDECERLLACNPKARICVIGSESGFSGSFDTVYADSKRALHEYVETRPLGPRQQLVCVAPTIIGDSGMTKRRKDQDNLARRAQTHPKRRFLSPQEVARLVVFLLYLDRGYITNTVIRMNGGEHIKSGSVQKFARALEYPGYDEAQCRGTA